MNTRRLVAGSLALPIFLSVAFAQAPGLLPKLDDKPIPQVDAGGPSAAVNALAFSNDGKTLYAAGMDKVVRVWTLQDKGFAFKMAYRVPIGPGNRGSLNAVALSPDGNWIAMAGVSPARGESGFREAGSMVPAAALSIEQKEDYGVIHVASTANPGGGKVLRGHRGEVRALAFAPEVQGQPPLLVSAATDVVGGKVIGNLRLWELDAVKDAFVLVTEYSLPAQETRPELAIWRAGPLPKQVRVAFAAWQADQPNNPPHMGLQVWEPDNERVQNWGTGGNTQTAAFFPLNASDVGSVLTGGFNSGAGRLSEWNKDGKSISTVANFPPINNNPVLPVGLAVVPALGPRSHVAAILTQGEKVNADYQLAFVDVAKKSAAYLPLKGFDWKHLPPIAATGQHVAVAAVRDRAIWVFAVDDLIKKGAGAKPAELRSAGKSLRQVAFVKEGLWLSEQDGKQAGPVTLKGGWVFDLANRQLQPTSPAGIAADTPNSGGWSWNFDKDAKGVIVKQGKQTVLARLPVSPRVKVEVTKVALRPPSEGRPGVLAVAYTETDNYRTLIMLCNPADGKPYRVLISHLQNVVGLAFSASKQLLASVAEDQTVCVWSLADLDKGINTVAGLSWYNAETKTGNEVVVTGVAEGSAAAQANLAKGDVLEKAGVPGGVAEPLKDMIDFSLALAARKPGDEIEVTIRNKGVKKLPVERGVDSRLPLFSLFLQKDLEWLGWSPAGPYDFSKPAVEARLGWHTNTTANPASPVSYAAAKEYRKDYHLKQILVYLANEADLGNALEKWKKDHMPPPPQPDLLLLPPDGAVPLDQPDAYLVRTDVKTLGISINNNYPLDDKHVLRWQLKSADGKKVNAKDSDISGKVMPVAKDWQLDLDKVEWRRGDYLIHVALRAKDNAADLAAKAIKLHYIPLAPKVEVRVNGKAVPTTTKEKPLVVTNNALVVAVDFEAAAGQKGIVHFSQFCNGKPSGKPPQSIEKPGEVGFTLQEDVNELWVRAVNEGGMDVLEEKRVSIWVSYKAPKDLSPSFIGLRVNPEPEESRSNDKKDLWVISKQDAILTGKIEANGDIVKAVCYVGNDPPMDLLGPTGGKLQRSLGFKINIKDLRPGEQKSLRLVAKSRNSAESEEVRLIAFHPPLPAITFNQNAKRDELVPNISLSGTFEPKKFNFDLLFKVTPTEGKPVEHKPTKLDLEAGTWSVDLSLLHGSNTIEALVKNQWREQRTVTLAEGLRYLKPPRIKQSPKQVVADGTNLVSLELAVESPTNRQLTEIRVEDKIVDFKGKLLANNGGYSDWSVTLPEVFVNDGKINLKELNVQACNDDGPSPVVMVSVVHKLKGRPPMVRLVKPAEATTSRTAELLVTFEVVSELPLERIEISGGAKDYVKHKDDLKNVKRKGNLFSLQETLKFKKGPNHLEFVAVNKDGRSETAHLVVSYVPSAVHIEIEKVVVEKPNQELIPFMASGDLKFKDPANGSIATLVGRVVWSNPEAKELDNQNLEVVIKVGDCRQFPARLLARGKGAEDKSTRKFFAPLVLIGEKNKIHVEIPSANQEERSQREFELACGAPNTSQRLHLLIVSASKNTQDEKELKNRVLDALGVGGPDDRPKATPGQFNRKPPFEECILYRVLAGPNVQRSSVLGQLVEINKQITRLQLKSKWINDVVLIYYQGEDWDPKGKGERYLKTSETLFFGDVRSAISCTELHIVAGAPLLLLNVTGKQNPLVAGAGWGGDPDTGFMRYAMRPGESGSTNPELLRGLEEAIRQKGRLGEVVNFINDRIGQLPVLDLNPYQVDRKISEPQKKGNGNF